MKINEKWFLFLIATFTTFFGIVTNFIKLTEAKSNEIFDDVVLRDVDSGGLKDVILNKSEIQFDSNVFSYDIKVDELDDLEILPVLSNDKIDCNMSIIGDKNVDMSIIVIITVNYSFNENDIYTFYIEEER